MSLPARAAALFGVFVIGTAIGITVARLIGTSRMPQRSPEITRLMVAPLPQHAISVSGFDRDLAISPDGRRVAYIGSNATAILVRDLDKVDPIRINVGGIPHSPFFSPDGAWIGFVDGFSAIRRVSVAGGKVETVCRAMALDMTLDEHARRNSLLKLTRDTHRDSRRFLSHNRGTAQDRKPTIPVGSDH